MQLSRVYRVLRVGGYQASSKLARPVLPCWEVAASRSGYGNEVALSYNISSPIKSRYGYASYTTLSHVASNMQMSDTMCLRRLNRSPPSHSSSFSVKYLSNSATARSLTENSAPNLPSTLNSGDNYNNSYIRFIPLLERLELNEFAQSKLQNNSNNNSKRNSYDVILSGLPLSDNVVQFLKNLETTNSSPSSIIDSNYTGNAFIDALSARGRISDRGGEVRQQQRQAKIDDIIRTMFESIIITKPSPISSYEFDYKMLPLIKMLLESFSHPSMHAILGNSNSLKLLECLTSLEMRAGKTSLNNDGNSSINNSRSNNNNNNYSSSSSRDKQNTISGSISNDTYTSGSSCISKGESKDLDGNISREHADTLIRTMLDQCSKDLGLIEAETWKGLCSRYSPGLTMENACVEFIRHLGRLDDKGANYSRGEMTLRIIAQFTSIQKFRNATSFIKKIKESRLIQPSDIDITNSKLGLLAAILNDCAGMASIVDSSSLTSDQRKSLKNSKELVMDLAFLYKSNDMQAIAFRSVFCRSIIEAFDNVDNMHSTAFPSLYLSVIDALVERNLIVGSEGLNAAVKMKFAVNAHDEALKYFDVMEQEKAFWYYHNVYKAEKPTLYAESLEKFFILDSMTSSSSSSSSVSSSPLSSSSSDSSRLRSVSSTINVDAYRQAVRTVFNDPDYSTTGPISFKFNPEKGKDLSEARSEEIYLSHSNLPTLGVCPSSYVSGVNGIYESLRGSSDVGRTIGVSHNTVAGSGSVRLTKNVDGFRENVHRGPEAFSKEISSESSFKDGLKKLLQHETLITGCLLDSFCVHKMIWLFSQSKQPHLARDYPAMRLLVKRVLRQSQISLPSIDDARFEKSFTVDSGRSYLGVTGRVDDREQIQFIEKMITEAEVNVGSSRSRNKHNNVKNYLFQYDIYPNASLDLISVKRKFDHENCSLECSLHPKQPLLTLPTSILKQFYIEAIRVLQNSKEDAVLCLQLSSLFLRLDADVRNDEIEVIMSALIENNLFKDCVHLYRQLSLRGRAHSEVNAHYMVQAMIGQRNLDSSIKMLRLLSNSEITIRGLILAQLLRYILFQLTPTGRQFDYGETQISDKVEDVIPLFLDLLPVAVRKTAVYKDDRAELIEHITSTIVVASQYHEEAILSQLIEPCCRSDDAVVKEIGSRCMGAIENIVHYFDKKDQKDQKDQS